MDRMYDSSKSYENTKLLIPASSSSTNACIHTRSASRAPTPTGRAAPLDHFLETQRGEDDDIRD